MRLGAYAAPTWALARADDLRDHGLSDGLDLLGEAPVLTDKNNTFGESSLAR